MKPSEQSLVALHSLQRAVEKINEAIEELRSAGHFAIAIKPNSDGATYVLRDTVDSIANMIELVENAKTA
jgi:endonuclease IV